MFLLENGAKLESMQIPNELYQGRLCWLQPTKGKIDSPLTRKYLCYVDSTHNFGSHLDWNSKVEK